MRPAALQHLLRRVQSLGERREELLQAVHEGWDGMVKVLLPEGTASKTRHDFSKQHGMVWSHKLLTPCRKVLVFRKSYAGPILSGQLWIEWKHQVPGVGVTSNSRRAG